MKITTQSISGQLLYKLDQKKGPKPITIPTKIVLGILTGSLGGLVGVIYHTGMAAKSLLKRSDDKQRAVEHIKSAGVDLFRLATAGIGAATVLVYGNNIYENKDTTKALKAETVGFAAVASIAGATAIHPVFGATVGFFIAVGAGLGKVSQMD